MNFHVHSIIFHKASSRACPCEYPLFMKGRCIYRPCVAVRLCTAFLATWIALVATARGRSVSVATTVCPRRTKVDGHVLCHIRVALCLLGKFTSFTQ